MTPDVTGLVAASRSDHPHHGVARTWLERALYSAESGATFVLMPMVVARLLRLVTSPKICSRPRWMIMPNTWSALIATSRSCRLGRDSRYWYSGHQRW